MCEYFRELLRRHGILLPDYDVPPELLFSSSSHMRGGPVVIAGVPSSMESSTSSPSPDSYQITCTDNVTTCMRKLAAELRSAPHKLNEYLNGLQGFLNDDGIL